MTEKNRRNYPSSDVNDIDDIWVGEHKNQPIAYDAMSEIERIHDALTDALKDVAEREPEPRGVTLLSQRERTLLLELFAIASAHIERNSTNILYEKLADKENREKRSTRDYFQDHFNQNQREGLLYRCGIIDSGLKGELAKVRQRRNELVHKQIKRRYLSDVNAIKGDSGRALRAAKKLDELANELIGVNSD